MMHRMAIVAFVLLAAACIVSAGSTAPPLGTIFASIGVWEERSQLVWLNVARQGPAGFVATYLQPASGAALATAVGPLVPLYPSFDLARAARAHSFDLQETPCTVRSTDCNGTSQFSRIATFYPDGITAESVAQVDSTVAQYFHTPRHFVRVLLCSGAYDPRGRWPLINCPPDGSPAADARTAMMAPDALRVGIGMRLSGGQLGNGCAVTHDYTNLPPAPDVYINKVRSATHTFNGVVGGQEMDNIRFIANYFDPLGGTPTQTEVWFDGRTFPMSCDNPPTFGVPSNCAYRSADFPVSVTDTSVSNCRMYFFLFRDAAGTPQRYPETGAFYTYGEGRCFWDWVPQVDADPVIAARAAGIASFPPAIPPPNSGVSNGLSPFYIALIVCCVLVFVALVILIVVCCWTSERRERNRKTKGDDYIRLDEPHRVSGYSEASRDSREPPRSISRADTNNAVNAERVDYRFVEDEEAQMRSESAGSSRPGSRPLPLAPPVPRQSGARASTRPPARPSGVVAPQSPRYDTDYQESLAADGGGDGTTAAFGSASLPGWVLSHGGQHGETFSTTPQMGYSYTTDGLEASRGGGMGGNPGTATMEALISEVPRPFDCLYTYAPSTLGELPVKQGEVVFVLPGDEQHPGGWAYVENEKGATGYIPSAYIRLRQMN